MQITFPYYVSSMYFKLQATAKITEKNLTWTIGMIKHKHKDKTEQATGQTRKQRRDSSFDLV